MQQIKTLYQQAFPAVARYVANMGGNLEEAKDVFHDALLIYMERCSEQAMDLRSVPEAYIFGVAKHLWTKRYQENLRYASLDQLMTGFERHHQGKLQDNPSYDIDRPVQDRIMRVLQAAGQKCMEVLTAFYYEKQELGKLAERFGFSNKRSATVQKFKCLQKVKQVVKEKSLQYEDFLL